MSFLGVLPILVPFFVAGLAGSLHCIGMCGPLLAAHSAVTRPKKRASELWVHAGRVWTYATLGLVAGRFGELLRTGSAVAGVQRASGIAVGAAIVGAGIVVASTSRVSGSLAARVGCAVGTLGDRPIVRAIAGMPGIAGRLLVGAMLGFLPCGLVYGMLVAAIALPTPLHAAAGMFVFGLGTVPALSVALATRGLVPPWLRARASGAVGAVLVLAGLLVIARSGLAPLHRHPRHSPHSDVPPIAESVGR
jgi:sulfite exporter TauE/SafE